MYGSTKKQNIIERLRERGDMGEVSFKLIPYGGVDTRKRVSELRKEGWPIDTQWIRINGRKYANYILKETR